MLAGENHDDENQPNDEVGVRRRYLRNPTANQEQERSQNENDDEQYFGRAARLTEWLRAKVDASNRSVRDISEDVGVAHVTLRSWLLGHNLPSSEAARKLARYYKVDEDWLLEMSGHRTSRTIINSDPERQEFLMWANANVNKIPVKQLRALRRMMEELAAED